MPSPRISVGLPVYNAEAFLEHALAAVLSQDVDGLEVVISDNASTDGTQALCEAAAASDPRVRYERQAVNLGAAPNYNRVFEMARAPYFKWLAHDDLIRPGFLATCVRALDENPDVVVACTRAAEIDADGAVLHAYPSDLRLGSPHAHERFFDVLNSPYRYALLGVIRRDVLARTPLIESFSDSDGCLLAELALHGPIYEADEVLTLIRNHPNRSTRKHPNKSDRARWFDTRRVASIEVPTWKSLGYSLRALHEAPLSVGERLRCAAALADWAVRLRWRVLAGELRHALPQLARRIVAGRPPTETSPA